MPKLRLEKQSKNSVEETSGVEKIWLEYQTSSVNPNTFRELQCDWLR